MKASGYKTVMVTQPAAIVDDASFTTATIDTKGFAYAEIFFALGATDIAMTVLKVQESDDSGMSGAADVTGLIFATSANDTGSTSTLPSATDDNKLYKFEIDLKGRKRYLDLVATMGNGTAGGYGCAWVNLFEAENVPTSATDKGIAQLLRCPVIS